jgi:hypothetical protein
MIERAFDAGWGGAVWKTLGKPIANVFAALGIHFSVTGETARSVGIRS